MGEVLMQPIGGSVSSSDVTITRELLLSGYTGLTADSNDEVVDGQLPVHEATTNAISWARSSEGKTNILVPSGGYINKTSNGYPEIVVDNELYSKSEYDARWQDGVDHADGRVNTESESYKAGYTARSLHVVKLGECRTNPLPSGQGTWSGNKAYTFDITDYIQYGITADNIVLRNAGLSWYSQTNFINFSAGGGSAVSSTLSGSNAIVYCPYAANRQYWNGSGWRQWEWYTYCDAYLIYYA
ncbi:hypothetical protein [Lachnoclostridium sp. Marseille-P6806]|uniref:hypothetical protein n=1 Tax=Lachnoclostridium sp. Marseille-P6806 TaxID=2364793 RepID=UPI0010302DE8|nr:hypothetical protein [Lachnoclostridium sp. Marseille-P6806]